MAAIPFVKDVAFEYGRPDWLSPLVRRVICNNPGPYTFTGSGTYIIGPADGPVAVIDPGPDRAEHLDALADAIGDAPVSDILITHTHSDHCGGARRFAERCGAPISGFGPHPVADKISDAPALDEGADYRFAPDKILRTGDLVSGDGWTLEAIETPGHLSNHLCFALREEKTLFTGDHIMGWATTVVAPPDGDMTDYINSLELLLSRDDETYLPTHGAPIENPKRFVRAIRTHRLMRDAQIIEQLKQGRTYIKDIVPVMYAEVDPRLHKAAALNVLAHLIRLSKIGSVVCAGAPNLSSEFRLTN